MGKEATKEQAQALADYIEETSDAEVEIYDGKQPVYSFILGGRVNVCLSNQAFYFFRRFRDL